MVHTIANPSWLYVVLFVVVGIPAGVAAYFGAQTITIWATVILFLLTGIVAGSIRKSATVDNVTFATTSLVIVGFLAIFFPLSFWKGLGVYIVGAILGGIYETKRTRGVAGET